MDGLINLNELSAGKELNPLCFADGDYPEKEVMIDFIERNNEKASTEINLGELSLNGVVVQDSMQKYLDMKRIGSSALKEALKTPRAFYYEWEDVFDHEEKQCFELGTFAHMAFLEPHLFDSVKCAPDVNLSTKDGVVEMIKFFQNLNDGHTSDISSDLKMQDLKDRLSYEKERCSYQIIQPEHFQIIQALKRNYYWYGGGIIPKILKGAKAETSFYGEDESTGLPVKVRPDYFNIKENIGVDAVISFKTTRCDDLGHFFYHAAKLKYELSEGMYQEVMSNISGRKFNVTIMIMLQTVMPYDVAVLWWAPDDLQLGKYKYHEAMSIVNQCFENNWFPGFDARAEQGAHGIIDMKLPEWAEKDIHPTDMEE